MASSHELILEWLKQPINLETGQWGTSITEAVTTVTILYVLYGIGLAVYRVTLHPLAGIPGPRLAAMTFWYEFYYEVYLGGKYFKQIKEMHDRYGPIIRINPGEVHLNDQDFIDTLYPTSSRKTGKPTQLGLRTGTPSSIVATTDHNLHRIRRNSINGFFSIASIRRLEPIVRERLEIMLRRWTEVPKEGQVLDMHTIFKAYASDIVTQYAFGDSFNFVEAEDWGYAYFSSADAYFCLTHVFGHIPWSMPVINNAPTWLLRLLIPGLEEMSAKQTWWLDRVRKIRGSPNPEEIKSTIFEGILASSLPPEQKTDARMAHDAQLIGLAGEGTTAYTLSSTMFELVSHPEIYEKVKKEISAAVPDKYSVPSFAEIENLQYFNAVIQESLRLHPGVMIRMMRTSPEAEIVYHDKERDAVYKLPKDTSYGMSAHVTQLDSRYWDKPYEFRPERWIENPTLGRAFIAFARGSRGCVGQNFARREMAMVLATIINRYEIYNGQEGPTLELYDTVRERDISCNSEMIIPMPAKGSHGLRMRVRY